MKILAIDSSSKPASAAVADDSHILSEVYVNNGFTHSKTLMNVVKDAIDLSDIDVSDIDLIVCVTGPGSFTGVRIGVACAKGIAFPNNTPCVGISTLEAMAYNCMSFDGYVCAIMDARCSQIYTATFKVHFGTVERITEDRAVSISQLVEELKALDSVVYLLGDGAHLIKKAADDEKFILTNESIRYQKASGALYAALNKTDYIAPDQLVPVYLRLPQAERELKNKLKGSDKQ
ncbi:MAG: tRNA (adenosine(37)-N6)-threonylcarbamoyltransferase complex dimerization subunit type 1 TsaB [Clostridia bacterium]|nr:tRNA (adenosine(37)-N6)-threonylcarbamoyltransferase complex dimerization subunit type 1 TsaB [Clostridia bacterium]